MKSRGHWVAVCLGIVLAGQGCAQILGFGEEPPPISNAGGSGGAAGGGGFGGSGGSGGTAGTGGTGGSNQVCPVSVCPNAASCNSVGRCVDIPWAKRFGTSQQSQVALSVATDTIGQIVIGGYYGTDAFDFGNSNSKLAAATGNFGFVALLDGTGVGIGSAWIANGEVRAVATDKNNAIIAAGIDYSSGMTVLKWDMMIGANNMPGATWTAPAKLVGATPTAITTDTNGDIYVIGDAVVGASINCPEPVPLTQGTYVIKYPAGGGACQWIQQLTTTDSSIHGAAINAKDGVWITGSVKGTLELSIGDGISGDATSGADMFLIQLGEGDGAAKTSYRFSGSSDSSAIKPAAIDVDAQTGTVYVAGMVTGPTQFASLESGKTGAFVVKVKTNAEAGAPQFTVLAGEGAQTPDMVARATGVAKVDTKLYVSGTFSEPITIAPMQAPVLPPNPGGGGTGTNTPFLAIFDLETDSFNFLSFEPFAGYGETYVNDKVYLAGWQAAAPQQSFAVLAGGWRNSLDFAHGLGGDNFLKAIENDAGTPNDDIFVAKFAPQP